MVNAPNALQGVIDLGDGLTPIDIWQGLHANAHAWIDSPYGVSQEQDRILIDGTDISVLRALSVYPVKKWIALCEAVGWTAYGAVGLSWCEGAELPQIWEAWEASGSALKPLPEYERPARFINPALLPRTRKITDIINLTKPNKLAFGALVAASSEPLIFDLSAAVLVQAEPQLAAFLKSRMLQVSNRSTEQNILIAKWSETIKGTEYDVWENS